MMPKARKITDLFQKKFINMLTFSDDSAIISLGNSFPNKQF